MLENLRRIRHREISPVHMGRSVDEFFDYLEGETKGGRVLPNWKGELYPEFHKGTYTTHGSIKKGNRHSEDLLRDVEVSFIPSRPGCSDPCVQHIATLTSLYHPSEYVYPKKRIDEAWEKVLLNQFHDGRFASSSSPRFLCSSFHLVPPGSAM